MNKTYSIFIVALLLCSSVGAWAQKQKMLTILHTNDTHSTIFPLSEMLSDTMTAGRGGFMRRVAMIKEERAKDPDLLLFDSGDFSQGSAYYTLYKGDVESGLMNLMHYDAGTIGNHEFDFGLDNMARVFRRLNFPILCANYDFTGTELDGLVKPYVILKRKGLKIGVFGLCPELDGLVDHKNFEPIRYHDPIAAAREMVQTLRTKHCDLIICLSHLGWKIEEVSDDDVIVAVEGIDLVLGGHSHSYFRQMQYVKDPAGREVPVDQNGKHAVYVGKIRVEMVPAKTKK